MGYGLYCGGFVIGWLCCTGFNGYAVITILVCWIGGCLFIMLGCYLYDLLVCGVVGVGLMWLMWFLC